MSVAQTWFARSTETPVSRGIKIVLCRLPFVDETYLRVDRPEFRHVAHHHAVGAEDHERASTLGEIWNDDAKPGCANFAPHYPDQFLGGVDATPAGVEQQIHVTVRRDIVEEIDEWHGVARIDQGLVAGHVAD